MAKQPEAIINYEVYEDGKRFLGISQAVLPNIAFLTQTINGSGMNGNVEAVLVGMMDAMSATLNFRDATKAAVQLCAPEKHNITLMVAKQHWDTEKIRKGITADKFVMVVLPKNTQFGTVAPASASDASGEYTVYYYAGYRDDKLIFEIDPWNYKCTINGKDYTEKIRKALGLA